MILPKILTAIAAGCLLAAGCNILPLSSTPSFRTNSIPASWKVYTNLTYGFSFRYPSTWTDYPQRGPYGNTIFLDSFGVSPDEQAEQLTVSVISSSSSLPTIAAAALKENDCPPPDPSYPDEGDHIISKSANGVLYVLYCSADAEEYHYIFKTAAAVIIDLGYTNNLGDPNAPEDQRMNTLTRIVASLRVNP